MLVSLDPDKVLGLAALFPIFVLLHVSPPRMAIVKGESAEGTRIPAFLVLTPIRVGDPTFDRSDVMTLRSL